MSDPIDVTAREGDDISLECDVGGDPEPVFTWTREDGRRIETARTDTLRLRKVMSDDEGVYQCTAENAVGSVSGSVSLIVHGEISFNKNLIFPFFFYESIFFLLLFVEWLHCR